MYLLVIGLVAVIVAFLVAAFLACGADMMTRTSQPGAPASVTGSAVAAATHGTGIPGGLGRAAATASPPPRGPRPGAIPAAKPGLRRPRPSGPLRAGRIQPARGYEPSSRGYGERPRPAATTGSGASAPPAPAAARARRRHRDRGAADRPARPEREGRAVSSPGRRRQFRHRPGTALYDTGPSAAAADDYATAQVNADPDLADSDVFPRVRADIPAASKARPRSQAKSRGRPSRKHDDDDDWPSTEWDKLSDEQYWAELSADKPLATTARTAQSSSPAAAKPARGQAARGRYPARRPRSRRARPGPHRQPP